MMMLVAIVAVGRSSRYQTRQREMTFPQLGRCQMTLTWDPTIPLAPTSEAILTTVAMAVQLHTILRNQRSRD